MKILITGSSGFIGTAIVNRLVKEGHEVVGLDIKKPKENTLDHIFVEGSILNENLVNECFEKHKPEVLIHLAAHMSLRESADAEERYKANTLGTEYLINAVRDCEVTKRAIYTSTKYIFRDGIPANDQDYNPDSSYGKSKVAMEKMIWESDSGNKEWCIARPTTIWGPGMSKHYQKFLKLVREGKYFHIGSHDVQKHMGFVENTAMQYEKIALAPVEKINRKVFYLTDYEPEVLRTWVENFNEELSNKRLITVPINIAKFAGKIGDLIKKMGVRAFPLTSFRVKNLTQDDICDASSTKDVCGELPYTSKEGAKITSDWFKSITK